MGRIIKTPIIILLAILSGTATAKNDNYINVKIDNKIAMDIPNSWKGPTQSVKSFALELAKKALKKENIDTSQLNGVKLFISPNKEAKLIFTVSYENTISNKELKNISQNDINAYNIGTKQNTINALKNMNVSVTDWGNAHISSINNNTYLTYSLTRTLKNTKTRVHEYTFHFKDRILTLNYSFIESEKRKFKPILTHILKSIHVGN